jgi:cyclase
MLKKRLIPCLFLMNGLVVRSEKFDFHLIFGNPIHQLERYNDWSVDELIYIDISREDYYDLRRDDLKVKNKGDILSILSEISKKCFIPLTFGGKIRTIDDIRNRIKGGADKITINTIAIENPEFITEAAKTFGSQCIVVSIDVKKNSDNIYEVYKNFGQIPTGLNPVDWAKKVEKLGAGEIFLNSIDKDGTGEGYDLELIKMVSEAVTIPVIACGGVGKFEDFVDGIKIGKASAVAAGNIFNFKEISTIDAKKLMKEKGIDVRI